MAKRCMVHGCHKPTRPGLDVCRRHHYPLTETTRQVWAYVSKAPGVRIDVIANDLELTSDEVARAFYALHDAGYVLRRPGQVRHVAVPFLVQAQKEPLNHE